MKQNDMYHVQNDSTETQLSFERLKNGIKVDLYVVLYYLVTLEIPNVIYNS